MKSVDLIPCTTLRMITFCGLDLRQRRAPYVRRTFLCIFLRFKFAKENVARPTFATHFCGSNLRENRARHVRCAFCGSFVRGRRAPHVRQQLCRAFLPFNFFVVVQNISPRTLIMQGSSRPYLIRLDGSIQLHYRRLYL